MAKKRMFCMDCGSANLGVYYPTPEAVGHYVINAADLHKPTLGPLTVLEPSAGTGELARLAVKAGAVVDCVEIQDGFVDQLRESGLYQNVFRWDFLSFKAVPHVIDYDRIIMNPPFENGADMKHVIHAIDFLKPGGILVAVMSVMAGQRERKADREFAQIVAWHSGKELPLPDGAFADVGTQVRCKMVRLVKRS